MPYAAPIKPLYFGRSAGEFRTAMMVYEPAKRPAAPIPHIARPSIRAKELGAAPVIQLISLALITIWQLWHLPHITLPSSKNAIDVRYVHFSGKKVYSRPHRACVAAVVMKNAEPYQPISWRLWNSSVMAGMAVAMIV
jgi:hypothetical protein